MKKLLLLMAGIWMVSTLQAANFRISHSEIIHIPESATPLQLKVTLAWDHAWRNANNHDAVWFFARLIARRGWGGVPLTFLPDGHQLVPDKK